MKPSGRIFTVDSGSDKFVELYYSTFDTIRQGLINYYANNATLVWNGNCINFQNLNEFFGSTPASFHTIESYDAHPISADTFLVHVNGSVQYGELVKSFSQTFLLKQDSKTKIISDHFRFLN
eukprot:NODE_116_length_18347_cov_2.280962.p15 type:complete len:122 gc:universal NODE_116_length_18347_cov_2.280962:3953-4318(+)